MSKEENQALPSWAVGAEASGGTMRNPCHSSLGLDSRSGSLVTVAILSTAAAGAMATGQRGKSPCRVEATAGFPGAHSGKEASRGPSDRGRAQGGAGAEPHPDPGS